MSFHNVLGWVFLSLSIGLAGAAYVSGEWDFKRRNDALNEAPDENGTAGAGGADFINHGEGQ